MTIRGRYTPEVQQDHGELAGLSDNDHTQYVNAVSDTASINLTLTGQSISGVVLILDSGTAQGQVLFWDNANSKWTHTEVTELFWDDVNKRLGIITNSPSSELDVKGTVTMSRLLAGGCNEG
jgi:hypothetical protein